MSEIRYLLINLDSLETVNNICAICQKYKEYFDIDIECGRYVTDGVSVLGVASMLGRIVKVRPICESSNAMVGEFYSDVLDIGAYNDKGE